MKFLLSNRIAEAIMRAAVTGGATGHAAYPASGSFNMAPAGTLLEFAIEDRSGRTGIKTRFPVTCITQVNLFLKCLYGDVPVTQQRTTIGVPQAIFGMHQDTKR